MRRRGEGDYFQETYKRRTAIAACQKNKLGKGTRVRGRRKNRGEPGTKGYRLDKDNLGQGRWYSKGGTIVVAALKALEVHTL